MFSNDQFLGVATFWLGIHFIGLLMYLNGQTGPGFPVYQAIYKLWQFELWVSAGGVGVIAMTLFIQFLFKEPEKPIQPPKPVVIHEPSTPIIVSEEPTALPEVDIEPPQLAPEELKIKALNQILGRRN